MNLAYELRPKKLEEFFGQEHLVGKDKILARAIASGQLFSMIFWGPPGSGKTTLAHLVAAVSKLDFYALSATEAGKEELRKIIQKQKPAVLFIDEIHHWNKAQQDALLPQVETGLITLIGATTENPSFEIISPLLSRCKVFILEGLGLEDLNKILDRGLKKLGSKINKEARELLIRLSGGDARIMLNALELSGKNITEDVVKEVFQTKSAGLYD
ncbi:AAA family ATPase, partial [Candidatus Gottesmanbacteria bacterium]|nr:AAA family ATPase [Candidatus Gottesmanbacteria bacterium]